MARRDGRARPKRCSRDWTALPPRWPLLPLTALGTFVLLGQTLTFRRLLAELPPWQPVALQTFRVGVELAFWRLHMEGLAPVQVTFEGRNFDGLVGLTAPMVAAGIASGWFGPRMTIAWNLFGLAMLVNAIGTVATSTPGPLHLNWPGEPFTAIATWPVIWIPALLAPIGIFLHVVSIRQSCRHGSPNADRANVCADERRRQADYVNLSTAFASPSTSAEDHESDGNRHA